MTHVISGRDCGPKGGNGMGYYKKPAKYSGVGSNHMSVAMKVVAAMSAFVAVGVGAGSLIAAFTKTAERNSVDLSYGSVSTPVEQGEVYSDEGGYDPIAIFARLNWKFAQQKEWYGEFSGYVDTVVHQDVHSYKYYRDDMLICADITESSLVNAAREFCYVKDRDRVLWREAAGGPSTYDKLDTPWQEGEPYRNMTISGEDGFKAVNGLPAYELSVYVIEPETVLSSSVEQTEDGLYKVTFVMNPAIWEDTDENGNSIVKGANAYYINQMIFTGGLPEAPKFDGLTVSFYFDDNWVTYKSEVEETYTAAYGVVQAHCAGGGSTTYSYEPYTPSDNPYPDAYEEYFQYYIDDAPDTDFDRPITALDALAGAFGPLLAEPSTLQLDLNIGGAKQTGTVFVDLSKTDLSSFDVGAIEARVGLGALNLWVEGGKAYLNYGGVKLSLTLSELLDLLSPASPQAEGEESGGLNTDDLLGALANGEFIVSEGKAELHSVLPLLGYEIPIDFYFNVDEEKNVTLERAAVALDLDGLSIGADLAFGGEPIPALREEEKGMYSELVPHIRDLIALFTSEELHADLGYEGHGVEVDGGIDIALSPFALKGEIEVRIPAYEASKRVAIAYSGGKVYLDLGGVKLEVGVADAAALVAKYLDLGSLAEGGSLPDLGGMVGTLLSPEFAQNILSSEEESKLRLLLRGTQILKALGIDFDLGDVSLEIASEQISASALGVSLTLTKGTPFTFVPEGYTDLAPYASRIAQILSGGYLSATLSYTGETLSVTGDLDLDLHDLAAKGAFTLSYKGASKELGIVYHAGELFLTVDGLRIKANVKEAVELVSEFVEISPEDGGALKLVADLFSLDFATIFRFGGEEDDLTLTVKGTELLQALGLSFDLGDIGLRIGEEDISLSAHGVSVRIAAGKPFEYSAEGSEIVPYAKAIADIYQSGYLALGLDASFGDLAIAGKVDIDLKSFNVEAALTLASGTKSKTADILYFGGEIYLGIDNIRLKVNAQEGAELLGGLLGLGGGEEETDVLLAILSADFSKLIPELWEADGALHITLSSGELLSLFGIDFDAGDLRFAVTGEGATIKLGSILITANAGDPFTPAAEGYLDITEYLGAVSKFAGAKAVLLDVSFAGENISLGGTVSVMVDGSAAKGDLTLTYRDREGGKADHAVVLLWTKEENTVYLSIDGIKVKANIREAIGLIKELIGKKDGETGRGRERAAAADLSEEELTVLEKLLSFDLGEFLSLTENKTEEGGTLSLTVKGTELLGALGLSFGLGDIELSVNTEGEISLRAAEGKLTLTVRGGEGFAQESTEGYIDIVQYAEYLIDLFSQNTYKVAASFESGDLRIRADVSFDTAKKLARGDLILIYKEAAKEASFIYENGWFYLSLGTPLAPSYRFKAQTTGAIALLAGYLGLSGTKDVGFDSLAKALDTSLGGLLSLHETEGEEQILTVLIDGSALLKALGVKFDLGEVDLQIAENYLYASVKGFHCEVTGLKVTLPELSEDDKAGYTDLSGYLDGVVNIFKQDYLTIGVNYDEKDVRAEGSIQIALKEKKARANLTLSVNGMTFRVGVVYENGMLYIDLDGAKIKADTQKAIDLVKGLFTKEETRGRRPLYAPADLPAAASLTAEQKDKLLGILETLLSLDLDDYFKLTESNAEGADSLTLTVSGTELLQKLLKKDIALGEVTIEVQKAGGIKLSVLGATVTAKGSTEGFELFAEGDGTEKYADVLQYAKYLDQLFRSEVLALEIEELSFNAGGTEISVKGTIDIWTSGALAGGTLTLSVGGKSFTLTLYYEKAEGERVLYLSVAGLKLKASIEDVKTLIDKLKTKEPAAAAFFTVAAAAANGDLFGIAEEDGMLQLAVDGRKLTELLGSDFELQTIGLGIAEGKLGLSLSAEKFSLGAILSKSEKTATDTPEDKDDYIDIVKYIDFAVDLFRKDAFEIGLGFTKEEFTITGSASFAPKSKVASGEFTITYGTTSKHATFAYRDGTAYIALDGSNGVMKFKAKSAASVALLAAYFGFSGTDKTLTNTFTDAFQGVFTGFDSLFALSENAEKDVLTLMIDGTQLLEKLKISLGSFELGDIGVKLGKDSLALSVLGLQVTLGGTDTAPVLPTEEELAAYTDLSDYADTLAALASSEYLGISISYTSKDEAPLSVKGDVYIAVKEKNIRANVTIEKGDSSIVLGVVYTGGKLYIDLDGAKIALDAKEAVSYLEELIKGAKGRARSVRNAPMAILNEEQTDKLLSVLKDLFTLELDNFFTVEEGEGGISILLNGTGLLQKLLKKEIALGDVKLTVGKSVFGADGTVEKCGNATLEALGATIVLGRSAQFTAFSEGDGAENYTDVLQYVKWAADIFAEQAKTIELSVASGDLTVGLKLNVVKGNAFMEGVITLTYQEKHKDFNFVYENAEGMIYLDLDGIKIKAKTEDILDLFKSLFKNVSGEEADTARTRALGYAAAAILNADGMAFGAFSLTEDENVLTLTVSGEKLMGLLGEKVQSLLGGKFSLEDVGLIISQSIFKVEAEAALSGSPVSLSVAISKGEKTELGEEKKAELASYIDVFKYGRMVKKLFTESAALQADIQATIGGKEFTLTFMFKKDFTMAQGTLRLGSLDLDIIYVLKDRNGAEGEKDVVLYVKAGENVKLMANVSEVIRLIKQAKDSGEAKGRARSAAPIALTPKQEEALGKFLGLKLGDIIALTETIATEGDSLAIAIQSKELLDLLGVNFDLGKIGINISEGELKIAVGEKVKIDLYGTTRTPVLEELDDGSYHDITPIVSRVVDLIEAQAIEFAGELSFGETKLKINEGIFSWKANEEKKFYLDASLGSVNVKLRIEGQNAKLQVGSFGVEFAFSDIGDLIDAVKGLIERVKTTLADIKKNVSGEFSRDQLVGSLEGIVEVLQDLIDFLGGSKTAADAADAAKASYDMGEVQIVPAALNPEESVKESFLQFNLGEAVSIDLLDETKFDGRGFLGLKLTVTNGKKTEEERKTILTATVDTAVFTGDFPELAGDFYKLSEFIEMLGYAGDAVALVSEPNLTASVNGNVFSTNTAMYVDAYEDAGLVYNITGKMEYCSNNTFPIHLEMDGNNLWVDSDLFVHFKLFVTAGSVSDGTNTTKPDNLFIDIYIADLDPETTGTEEKKGEVSPLDFFIVISKVGDESELSDEDKKKYDPLRIYAPADEVMTILSGVAALTGLDAVDYVSDYLIRPWISGREYGEEMAARLKGLGVSLVPTILDLLLKDTNEAQKIDTIAEGGEGSDKGFDISFGDVVLSFKSSEAAEDGSTYLAMLGVTTTKDEQSGDATYKKTTDLTFEFDRNAESILPEIKADDKVFDVKGVDELLLALARTATHLATEEEVDQHIAAEGEYVRNDLFFVDGKLHLDLSIIGINIETIEINVLGLTVNFDANNQISLNAKLSYDGVYNVLAGLAGDSTIIKGDTVLDITIADGMLYMRREQTSDFGGRNNSERELLNEKIVIYRAMPLANFAKDTQTMMNNICFMFNLSEDLIKTIMNAIPSGGTTPAAPSDIGGLFYKYIDSCTYEDQGDTNGLKNLLYTLVLNGAGLTNSDSFGNITVKLGVEKGVLRSIEIPKFSIASVVNINANLGLRNPEYVWDDGYSDLTEDIAGQLKRGMDAKLQKVDWNATTYLEGQFTTVTYKLQDQVLGTQEVVFEPNTKELYATLSYPDIESFLKKNPSFRQDGYTYEWVKPNPNDFKAGMTISAQAQANTYELVFIIEKVDAEKYQVTTAELEAAGYSWDEAKGAYTKGFHWTYDPENYIDLPYITTKVGKIIGFRCPNEKLHNEDHRGLDFYNQPTVEYRAEWEYIDYTVTFDFGNGTSDKKTGHYEDPLNYPDAPERTGYTFAGWDVTVSSFTGNMTIHANYTPNTYQITLVSEYAIEDFTPRADGKYVKTINYVYDTQTDLPVNIRADGYILNGWSLTAEDTGTHFTQLPAIAENREIYAVWDIIGFDIRFVVKAADSTTGFEQEIAVKNFKYGDTLANLPEVPQKDGYTGAWDIPADYTVSGEDTIYAVYTGIHYYITEYSLYAIAGYTEVKGEFDSEGVQGSSYWKKTYEYVFGGEPHPLTLGDSKSVKGYDFMGYFTERFGQGWPITSKQIDDDMIRDIFGFNVGDGSTLDEQNVLYVYWEDNSVEVHLYSDVDFADKTGHDVDGYYKSLMKMEGDYDISGETITPNEKEIQQIGWWYNDPEKGWRMVTDVGVFRNHDNKKQATVKLFALWVTNIKVSITTLVDKNSTYDIGGNAQGGEVYPGGKSAEIYEKTGMTNPMTGIFKICGRTAEFWGMGGNWTEDTLQNGAVFNIDRGEGGSFLKTGMMSFNAVTWQDSSMHGGVIITVKFTMKDGTVAATTTWTSIVSFHTYDVRVLDENGNELKKEAVRLDYDRDEYDNAVYTRDVLEGSVLHSFSGVEIPKKEGYTGYWTINGVEITGNEKITGATEIRAAYKPNPYPVEFTSGNDFADCEDGAKNYLQSTKELAYGTKISFIADGAIVANYTVGLEGNIFAVPAMAYSGAHAEGYTGKWHLTENAAGKVTFTAVYTEKTFQYTIIFHHNDGTETVEEVPYIAHRTNTTYEVTSLKHSVTRDYYEFTGWYFDDACEKLFDKWTAMPNATLEVYAGWKAIEYTIVYESQGLDGAEFTNPNDKVWKDGVEITLKEVSYSGYAFDGWFAEDGTEVTKIDKDNAKQYIDEATSTITLYAKFHKDTVYKFQYNTTEHYGDLSCSADSARVGENITLPAYDANGLNKYDYDIEKQWYFAGWKLPNDETLYELGSVVTITADHVLDSSDDAVTITAVWKEKVVLTVNITATGKEGTKSLIGRQKDGEDVTLDVTLSGKTVKSKGTGGKGSYGIGNVAGSSDPQTLTVYLKPDQDYTITYEASSNASVNVTGNLSGTAKNENITITITAN